MEEDRDFLARVLDRMGPYVLEGVIKLSRVVGVVSSLNVPDHDEFVKVILLRLADRGIPVVDDQTATRRASDSEQSDMPPPGRRERLEIDVQTLADSIRAARERIHADRLVRNPSRVILSAQEEVGLGLLIRGQKNSELDPGEFALLDGEQLSAATCLYLHNLRLVHAVARTFKGTGLDHDDLFQYGAIGLIRAVEKFDPHRGFKFSTYATWWIRQSMQRGVANDSRLIRIPVHMFDNVVRVWKARERLEMQGLFPSPSNISSVCELSIDEVTECLRLGRAGVASLDRKAGRGATTLGQQLVHEPSIWFLEERVGELGLKEEIQNLKEVLTERQWLILNRRFGLDGSEPQTLEEIGIELGLTREAVRQIEKKALRLVRESSQGLSLREFL